jgi:hypothetical protein
MSGKGSGKKKKPAAKKHPQGDPRKRAAREAGVLADHRGPKRRLLPPLMQNDMPWKFRSWHRETLPDFLWIALMLGRRSAWAQVRRPLDILDQFVPEGPRFLDGRLTTFALVPEERRRDAVLAVRDQTPFALPELFGQALLMFPSCPARWLYEGWLAIDEAKRDDAIGLVRSLIAENADKAGVPSTRLRFAAFGRRVRHGKFSHTGEYPLNLFPNYPHNLPKAQHAVVESTLRAMYGALAGQEADEHPEVDEWPRAFWARCRELLPCRVAAEREEIAVPDGPDGPVDPEPLTHLSEIVAVLRALEDLGTGLQQAQQGVVSDPENDEGVAVLLGFASRIYRLAYDLIERPSAWAGGVATLHLRPLIDARITSAWLALRNDRQIFGAYREHGIGRLKLLREHVKADMADALDDATAARFLEHLDQAVNLEIDEGFQPINLGSFTDVSTRDMAVETKLKRIYDLGYASASAANHGDWTHVRDFDTDVCTEPLHGGHRIGRFRPSVRTLSPTPARQAFALARDGITDIFKTFGVAVSELFEPAQKALNRALFAATDELQKT